MSKAFISGCAGPVLQPEEIAFFERERPWGLILFARNIDTADQVRQICRDFRKAVGRNDAPVLIDQEGGRVQRVKPPLSPKFPAPKLFGDLYSADPEAARKAAFLGARLIAMDLADLGITIDCIPCLDVRFAETSNAIGDRALSDDPDIVADLGRAMADGALAGGVLPVIKHMPGHGRAKVDSHYELPRVSAAEDELKAVDFRPFKALSDLPFAMTAHILFEQIDPDHAATQSREVIGRIIRKEIGFDGCLMSDDLSMKALGGDVEGRAARTIAAGCDLVLHCNGDMTEMEAVARGVPELGGRSLQRCQEGLGTAVRRTNVVEVATVWSEFEELTGWPRA